jgi:VanZ family protein
MKIGNYWPSILWALVILILTIVPSNKIPEPPHWAISFDKLIHLLLFMVLGLLILFGRQINSKIWRKPQLWWIVSMLISYGLLLELFQILVPGRNFSWMDLVADAIGVIIGAFFFLVFIKPKGRI